MKLTIQNEGLKVMIVSEEKLTRAQVDQAYSIATENETKTVQKPVTTLPNLTLDSALRLEDPPSLDFRHDKIVKAIVSCPKCGITTTRKVRQGFKYVKCGKCGTKLFLKPAGEEYGMLDQAGYYYHANTEYRERGETTMRDKPALPDEYSTLSEITKYLDCNGIDHHGIRLKGDLLAKVKEAYNKDHSEV
jgi:hypothetical protein